MSCSSVIVLLRYSLNILLYCSAADIILSGICAGLIIVLSIVLQKIEKELSSQ